jgi:hypothetical protein
MRRGPNFLLLVGVVVLAAGGCQDSSVAPTRNALTQADYDKMSPQAKQGYKLGMASQNAVRARMGKPPLQVLGGNEP